MAVLTPALLQMTYKQVAVSAMGRGAGATKATEMHQG